MKNYNEIAEELFERRETYNAAKRQRRKLAKRTAAALSCVCIAVLAGVIFRQNIGFNFAGSKSSAENSAAASEKISENKAGGGLKTTTVTEYKAGGQISSSYKTPENGEYFCFMDVEAAREHYKGKDAVFVLAIDIFSDEGEATEEQKAAEYKRLKELGYTFYEIETFSYEGEGVKMPESVLLVQMTDGELEAFTPSPEYGYAFRFVHNGDGSAIDFDDAVKINDF